MNFVAEHRMGHVRVSVQLVDECPEAVMLILREGLIIRVESFVRSRELEYTMLCPAFDIALPGQLIPTYKPIVEKITGETPDDPELMIFKGWEKVV